MITVEETLPTQTQHLETPVGWLELAASEHGLQRITFLEEAPAEPQLTPETSDAGTHLARAASQLTEYFAGTRQAFDLVLTPQGTDFQQAVWRALERIPAGETRTYQDLANALQNPKAVRAVGAANGQNPLAIVLPCHRVIGADGTLTGYAGGLERKAWLLRHEGYHASASGQTRLF